MDIMEKEQNTESGLTYFGTRYLENKLESWTVMDPNLHDSD